MKTKKRYCLIPNTYIMAAFVIIVIAFLFFYWMLKISGLLDSNKKQEEKPSRPIPKYSPNTIRDIPKPKQKEIIVKTLDLPDDHEDGIYESKIAGISLHCTDSDKGIFNGVIYNEVDNPYNNNAMAIVSMKKKLIGYIPENELKDYWYWSNGLPVTCVGFIKSFVNEEGKKILFGRVTAIKPCNSKFVASTTLDIEEEIRLNEYLSPSRI